jgi:CheY-like chemotaxis protein
VSLSETHPVVLVAEDNENDLFMLQRAFIQIGFNTPVQYVRDGEQTIAYLAGREHFANREEYPLPCLLLLDLKMPRKNGFDVLAWIREQPMLANLRTVVLTTSDDISEINRAYQLGASSFLTKPLNFNEFKDTIQAVYNYWTSLNKPPTTQRPERPPIINPYLRGPGDTWE